MRRLVFLTQQVDPEHPALAATLPKIAALARRVDSVTVLADAAVPGVLPENCRVRTFGAPSKLARGARFAAALAPELRPRPIAIVAHMAPVFALLAAPLARAAQVPLLLWYTHWHASPTLRAAERVANAIVTVDRGSFPLDSPKVHPIGHGIDVDEFHCRERDAGPTVRVLALGRYSPAKGLDHVLHGIRLALDRNVDVRFDAHGPMLSELERAHRAELEALIRELRLSQHVALGDALPRRELPDFFAASDVLVNNMRAGAPDKVVYEAAASCLPVLASNPVFEGFLGADQLFARERPSELAARLERFAQLGRDDRARLGRVLRELVARDHSVETWADRVLAVAEGAG